MVYFLDLVGFVLLNLQFAVQMFVDNCLYFSYFSLGIFAIALPFHTDRLGPSSNDYFTVQKYFTRLNVIVSCWNFDVGGCAAAVLKSIISAQYERNYTPVQQPDFIPLEQQIGCPWSLQIDPKTVLTQIISLSLAWKKDGA